ncbi:MAG: hypothetical protein K0U41_05325 [Gammaproteobacteria bacterium]|nr:hypothetical protein [Gammaproteobacteria bacterium]
MKKNSNKDNLLQKKNLEQLFRQLRSYEFITVYQSGEFVSKSPIDGLCIISALVSENDASVILEDAFWDYLISDCDGRIRSEDNNCGIKCAYPRPNGRIPKIYIQRLVYVRNFDGLAPGYCDLSEEFRYFFNLFETNINEVREYSIIDEDGSKIKIAKIERNRVMVRKLELQKFLAYKKLYLSIQFDGRANSQASLEELGIKEGCIDTGNKQDYIWKIFACNGADEKGVSVLQGKHIVKPLIENSNVKVRKYEEYIVGVDDMGENIMQTCNPAKINNKDFMKLTYFEKDVLDKYYDDPEKFTVTEYSISGPGFILRINSAEKDISVLLGDLGQNLLIKEQKHFSSKNIIPPINPDNFHEKYNFDCEFTELRDHSFIFRDKYDILMKDCKKILGWNILTELTEKDRHCLTKLRVLTRNNQASFDDIFLYLYKIFYDGLNWNRLYELTGDKFGNSKNFAKLHTKFIELLQRKNNDNNKLNKPRLDAGFIFLKTMRGLRNAGPAHKKNSQYDIDLEKSPYRGNDFSQSSRLVFLHATEFVELLHDMLHAGCFAEKSIEEKNDKPSIK